jgi:hypothetical protein
MVYKKKPFLADLPTVVYRPCSFSRRPPNADAAVSYHGSVRTLVCVLRGRRTHHVVPRWDQGGTTATAS